MTAISLASRAEAPSAADLRAQAVAALGARDFAAAAKAWGLLREVQPDHPAGHVGGVSALLAMARHGEAAALVEDGLARFPAQPELLAFRATIGGNLGKWAEAERDWLALRELTPGQPRAVLGLARALAEQGRGAEADALLEEACAAAPADFDLLCAHAEAAARQGNLPLAEQRWRKVMEACPSRLRACLGLAENLVKQKRLDDAEAVLDAASADIAEEQTLAEARARLSTARGDWDEAERRWSEAAAQWPKSFFAWHGIADVRFKRGNLAGADEAAAAALARFPTQPALLSLHGAVAMAARDWPSAAERWDRLRRVAPAHADGWLQLAIALRRQGRDDEAAEILGEAAEILPRHPGIAEARADVVFALRRWPEARTLTRALHLAAPQNRRLQLRAFEAGWRTLGAADPAVAEQALRDVAGPAASASCKMMLRFESLGDDNEFARVQRHFGAEPFGLFRWAEISTQDLVAALNAGLAGVGFPENVSLRLGGDYKVRDRRHGLMMHTFVKDEQVDPASFLDSQCRRMRFLRDEFMEDLAEAKKVFVYKSSKSDPMAEVVRLHAALRKHGQATMLYIRIADPQHPGGTVEQVRPGLIVGYLDRIYDEQDSPNIAHDAWMILLRRVLALVDGPQGRDAQEASAQEVVERFESMGNNCELGLVQRHFRAEPLGLLRWNSTTLKQLANALEDGLEGVGDVQNTELFNGDDIQVADPRYGLSMRSFVRGDEPDRDAYFHEQCRRMRVLRKQLLSDLRAGAKIFVHKTARAAPLEEVRALHGAMRRYGTATLLHVRPPESGHASGHVHEVAPGLLIGYLDRLVAAGGGWGIVHEDWLALCRTAIGMLA